MIDLSKFHSDHVKCAGLGEILFDVYVDGAKLGGAPANFAYHCKQQGFDSIVISAVGNDEYGQKARLSLAKKFLPAYLPIVDYKTGYVSVKLDENAIAHYEFANDTAYDNLLLDQDLLDLAKEINVVCFGTLAQRCEKSRYAINAFLDQMDKDNSIKIYDINLRQNYYTKEIILNSIKRSDIIKCNEDELPIICKMLDVKLDPLALFEYVKGLGVNGFIYTQGGNKSEIYFNNEYSSIETPKIDVIDTVGAGDSFTAAFVCNLLKGKTIVQAHKIAVDIAAMVCQHEGAMPDYVKQI